MVGVWEGLNLGSIPNFFLCFGMRPKIIDVHPKLIPKGGVVQFCQKKRERKREVVMRMKYGKISSSFSSFGG